MKLDHYLIRAGIGLAISFAVCVWFWITVKDAPWKHEQWLFISSYFSLSGAYFGFILPIICRILTHNNRENQRSRSLAVLLIGASLGLFVLSWQAILGVGLIDWIQELREIVGSPASHCNPAYDLLSRATLLLSMQTFLDNCFQFAAVFAGLAMLGLWINDSIKPPWAAVSFVTGLISPSLWFFSIFNLYSKLLPLSYSSFCTAMCTLLMLGFPVGIFMVIVVWSVRAGWWSPGDILKEHQNRQMQKLT